jgi:hypothetical protein
VKIIISDLTDDIPRLKRAAIFAGGTSVKKTNFSADINTIPSSQLHGVVEWIFAVGNHRRSDAPRFPRAERGKKTDRRLPTERGEGETLFTVERERLNRKKSAVQGSAIQRDLSRHLRLECRQRKATTKKSRHGKECALDHGENTQPKRRERQQNIAAEDPDSRFVVGIPAVPFIMPFLLGVVLLRRAGEGTLRKVA